MRSIAAIIALASFGLATAQSGPPASPVGTETYRMSGHELVDPYRWLEGSAAPEAAPAAAAELDQKVSDWTDAQNAWTRRLLDGLPGRAGLEDRLRGLMEIGSVSAPISRGRRLFYTRRDGKMAQPTVVMVDGKEPARVLLDPNAIDPSGLTAIPWFSPDPRGRLLAFGMYASGDENATLHLLDVDRGIWLADEIPGRVSAAQWLPDSSGFFYRCLSDPANPYSGRIAFHRLGTHRREDATLFDQFKEGPLATTWGPFADVSDDARWMALSYATGTASNDLWAIDLDRWFREGVFERREITVGAAARSGGPIVGDTLFMETEIDAPNGRIVAVDLNDPRPERWKTVVAERRDAVIEATSIARGILVVTWLTKARTEITLHDLDGRLRGTLPLPGIGTASISTNPDRTEAFVSFTSFNTPPSIYRVDLATLEESLWERTDVPVDPDSVVVEQVQYASKDGTPVTMFLVHKKGIERNGDNPTILYGYGGFNVSLTPTFSATLFPWFEAGGIYAVANLRGGGEYGRDWHAAGMLDKKQNVFDDFHAAAEWLVAQKYTRPARLAAVGGSNGGLLTGVAVTQRPELFAAAISAVPLLDMLRYQNFLMARYWVPEYGSAEDPEQFAFLSRYSPYQQVKEGTAYPAVLFTAGEHDSRVHPLHARKMAARMQAATSSDPAKRPILLWVDRDGGHGQGKPLELRVREVADQRIFLMWQLGMLERS